MSKTYVLQRDIHSPFLNARAGEKVVKENGIEYYYIGDKVYFFNSCTVENNPEWFLPEENKSNDSFQWTSELQELYISELEDELRKNSLLPHFFRKKFVDSHTPKQRQQKEEPLFTPREYEEYGERCFNAAKIRFPKFDGWGEQYPTFQDYKNSMNDTSIL